MTVAVASMSRWLRKAQMRLSRSAALGSGRNDSSVQTLSREGRLAVHGMAISPGETAAFGFVGARPVLLLPGRLDAALSVWLVVGRRLLDRLAAAKNSEHELMEVLTLARKVPQR